MAWWRNGARMLATVGFAASVGLASGCGGAKGPAKSPAELLREQVDGDALALLPPSPVTVANIDTKAFFASELGQTVNAFVSKSMVGAEDAGFVPSRDLERVVVGSYSAQGVDLVVVLRGNFDEKRIHAAIEKKMNGPAPLVRSTYAERTVYTANNQGFTLLSARTALAGSEGAMRRTLDRLRAGPVERSIAPWMIQTLDTPNAAFAVTADLASQSLAASAIGTIKLDFVKGIKTVRVLGAFDPPGIKVHGTVAYASAGDADAAAKSLQSTGKLLNALALAGVVPHLKGLNVKAVNSDVDCSFDLDRRELTSALEHAQTSLAQ